MTRDESIAFHLRAALQALHTAKRRPASIYAAKRNIEAAMKHLEPAPHGPLRPIDDVISELGAEIDKMRQLIMSEVVRRLPTKDPS